jgi:hypothetical protein
MSKKDYAVLAAAVKKLRSLECTWDAFMSELCIVLKKDNANFDSARFRAACEPD